jgi:phenylalanyl-tRNA synthetase alpha chain
MDLEKIKDSLSPIERKVLPRLGGKNYVDELVGEDLDKTTIMRAINFLKNKNLVRIQEDSKKVIGLGILGVNYKKKELPERTLLNKLLKSGNLPVNEIKNCCNLNENEAKVALGVLRSKALVIVVEGKVKIIAKPDDTSKEFLEERFLKTLPRDFDSLEDFEKLALEKLKKRKEIIELKDEKKVTVELTEEGLILSKEKLDLDYIEQVTPKLIKTMAWKGKKFRRYDLQAGVPRLFGGKRHFVNQATDYAKSIWLLMGFREMTGDLALTGFWNFDSLFTAQDHPVREMQDTFYIKGIQGKLPDNKKLISETKRAHEGGIDGSLGWSQKWGEDASRRVLLRTHTTPLSIKTLHKIAEKKEYPAKYFALGKCFRNETVDWSHGFEFNQTEGIVIDENANFRHLLGYLMQFFNKMGYEKVRLRPAYFPYTEPSLEIDVFHPVHKKWVELGGAGMFRPEVTIPIFGKHIPVLAWGPGFDRIIMEFFEINDLRDMYKNDLNKLREIKFFRS